MRKSMVALLAGASIVALLAGGCANKEAVKPEEAVVPAASAAKAAPATSDDSAEKARLAEQARLAEEARLAEQARLAEEARLAAAAKKSSQESTSTSENKFETAYFDFDKAELRQDARDVLSKNAETILKSLPGAKIQIEGHCDERGSAEYNMALGENRAKSAQKYLTTLGVKGENLSIISYGKEKPAVQGSDEAAWAKNRRAEFVIVK